MASIRTAVITLTVLCALAGCNTKSTADAESDAGARAAQTATEIGQRAAAQVRALADAYVEGYFNQFPEHALVFGTPDPDPARLSDPSLESLSAWQHKQAQLLAQLEAVDARQLTDPAAILTANLLRNQLESARDLGVCRGELMNVSPTWTGWMAGFNDMAGALPLDSAAQRADALSRLKQIPRYIDSEIANLKAGVSQGYTAAKNSVRAVGDMLDAFLELPAAETPFVMAARQQEADFQRAVAAWVAQDLMPAIRRYRDYLRNDYVNHARDAIGIDGIPNGEACYRASVRYWATVDLTAAQIHQIGLAEMERILAELSEVGERSFGIDDPIALLKTVKTDARYLFESREQMVQYAEAALARAQQALPQWFGRIPKAPVIVEPYPEYQEKSAPLGQAQPASADGSRPGKYLINTYKAETQSKAGLEATAFHEAYPGHHTQFTIAQERTDLHPISRYFYLSGFGEGWALYTERLADEMDLYSSDIDRVGMLSNEAWRAARMVVDSGIHGLGWSKEQALDYLDSHNANARALNAAEIDRYIAVPGQATSYMLGALEIRRLRNKAQSELGDRFDIRQFHDLVLEDGAIPLTHLGSKVADWIAKSGR